MEELIAAHPHRDVAAVQPGAERSRESDKDAGAGGMTEAVIDPLQAVTIEGSDAEHSPSRVPTGEA